MLIFQAYLYDNSYTYKKYVYFNFDNDFKNLNMDLNKNFIIEQDYKNTCKIFYNNKFPKQNIHIPYNTFLQSKFYLKILSKYIDYKQNKNTGKRLSISSYIEQIDEYLKFYKSKQWINEEIKNKYYIFRNEWIPHWINTEVFVDEIHFEIKEKHYE